MGALMGTSDVLFNMTKGLNKTQDLINQQKQDASRASVSPFIAGLAFAFLLYIAGIVITFVVKNTKVVGIALLVIGVISYGYHQPVGNYSICIVASSWNTGIKT